LKWAKEEKTGLYLSQIEYYLGSKIICQLTRPKII